ncbi:hypothetical protein GCM10010428_76460 [Actinosynnema pretiosum subsp. pretiosum]
MSCNNSRASTGGAVPGAGALAEARGGPGPRDDGLDQAVFAMTGTPSELVWLSLLRMVPCAATDA